MDSQLLIQSIAQLEVLASLLADEVQKPPQQAAPSAPERRLCKEALLSISVLLPKLQAVRHLQAVPANQLAPCCPDCDD